MACRVGRQLDTGPRWVVRHLGRQREAGLDAVDGTAEQGGDGQVGVRARVDDLELDVRAVRAGRPTRDETYGGLAVLQSPAESRAGPVAGLQPRLREHGAGVHPD